MKAKRVIAAILVALMIIPLFTLTAAAQTEGTYYVRVETNPFRKEGAHIDRVYVPYGETCTLTMDAAVEDFVFWNIHGDYEIVAGDYEENTFTIRPLSNVVAVATYKEAMPHTAVAEKDNPAAVQTGADTVMGVIGIMLMVLMLAVIIAAFIKNRRKIPTLADLHFACNWDSERECDNSLLCEDCPYQPADDDKPNGRNDPIKVKWDSSEFGTWPECPSCGEMPYSLDRCFFCGQKFDQDDPDLQDYRKQPEEIRMDCFACGGVNTLVGHRAKCNGHFHGHCEKCGVNIIE